MPDLSKALSGLKYYFTYQFAGAWTGLQVVKYLFSLCEMGPVHPAVAFISWILTDFSSFYLN